ncbi:MAG TPA: hypothetical protein VF806_01360 [Anaerolineaceae bacterium]
MAKIKVSKRPSPGGDITLLPSRLRMFLVYLVLLAVALAVGLALRFLVNRGGFTATWLEENWPAGLIITFGGSALLAFIERNRWKLRVLDGDRIEGPTGTFGERIVIPVDEIDWTRTLNSLRSWLKIGNAIYGSARVRIIISQWFFHPNELKELLKAIGYEKNAARLAASK